MNKKIVKKTIGASLGLAGMGIGLGIIGDALDSEGISKAGSTAVSFMPAVIGIGMGAAIIDMTKDLRRKKRGK